MSDDISSSGISNVAKVTPDASDRRHVVRNTKETEDSKADKKNTTKKVHKSESKKVVKRRHPPKK
jgi:hypothetical protein